MSEFTIATVDVEASVRRIKEELRGGLWTHKETGVQVYRFDALVLEETIAELIVKEAIRLAERGGGEDR